MARKRHHESKRESHRHESMGMKKAMHSRVGSGEYEGPLNIARREEHMDFEMIREDHKAVANLPQEVKYHAWPKVGHYADYDLDDTIRGIDEQMDDDGRQMMRRKGGNKW